MHEQNSEPMSMFSCGVKPKGVEESFTSNSIFPDEHCKQVHWIFTFPVKILLLTQNITTLW
jgi:hypothetical protein